MHTSKIIQLIIVLFIIFILIHHFCLNNKGYNIDGIIENFNKQLQEGFYQETSNNIEEDNYENDIKNSLEDLKVTRENLFNLTKKGQKKKNKKKNN